MQTQTQTLDAGVWRKQDVLCGGKELRLTRNAGSGLLAQKERQSAPIEKWVAGRKVGWDEDGKVEPEA